MKRLLILVLALFLLVNGVLIVFFMTPLPKSLQDLKPHESMKILDRNGTLLYEVLPEEGGRNTFLPIAEIPKTLVDAFLAAEDKRFYEHSGVDAMATLRAVWQNVAAGEVVSGGSTITQQLVRNLLNLRRDASFFRKIKESLLALKLTRLKDRDQILEAYLNTVYFGGMAYGAEAAAWQYFDKSAKNLDLAEAAFLAGLPQSPNRFYPFQHFDAAKTRQEAVLKGMLADESITQAEHDQAVAETLHLKPKKVAKRAPHFVDFVVSYWGAYRGADGGSNRGIKTTLDLSLQEKLENLIASYLTFVKDQGIGNAAAVVLDPKTGDVLAMVGSSDYFDSSIDGAVNVATSLRQPGSALKPILYAAAFEKGWTPETVIPDEPVQFMTDDGLPYEPKNYDLEYHGPVTAAQALGQSLNIPAVRTLSFVGVENFVRLLRDFGFTSFDREPNYYGLSLALGSGEVELLELTSAYGAFAAAGKRCPVRILMDQQSSDCSISIQPKTASLVGAILSNNELRMPEFGEENPLHFDYPVAAKTGTSRNFKDNWTVGYTDDFVVGVWAGNSSGKAMKGTSGISGAAPLFGKIISMLHDKTKTRLTVDPAFIPKSVQPIPNTATDLSLPAFRIVSPFASDVFLFDPSKPAQSQLARFESSLDAEWFVDGRSIGRGTSVFWPIERGTHQIRAVREGEEARGVEILVR